LQEAHPSLLDLHLLGADADDRVGEAHQNAAGRRRGPGHVLQFESSVLVLSKLFHDESALLERIDAKHGKLELAEPHSKAEAGSKASE
jgi:hypothetical protein